jgi:hypothetical protein
LAPRVAIADVRSVDGDLPALISTPPSVRALPKAARADAQRA